MKNHFKTWCKIGNTLGVTGKKKKNKDKAFWEGHTQFTNCYFF